MNSLFKKIGSPYLLALFLAASVCSIASAQVLVYEPFDYTGEAGRDGLLGATGSGYGFDGEWTDGLGGDGSNVLTQAVSGSLASTSFPSLVTNGNSLSFQGDGGNTRIFRELDLTGQLASFVDGGFVGGGAQDGALYFSFLMGHEGDIDFDEINVAATSILEVGRDNLDTGSNAAFTAGIDTLSDPDQRAVTNKTATGVVPLPGLEASIDFIVLELDFAANATDTLNVYINPTSTTQPGSPDGTLSANLAFNRIGVGGFQQSPAGFLDEIRIASTYEGAFAAPGVLGDVDGNGIVELADYNDATDGILNNFFSGTLGGPAVTGEAFGAINGVVDINDFVVWKREFELAGGSLAGIVFPGTSVPEPASAVVLMGSVMLGLWVRGRRSSAAACS